MSIDRLMRRAPVIPVLAIEDIASAKPLAAALVAGGLPVLEVTLRTGIALDAIRAMREIDGAIVGAGTVTRAHQFAEVASAGAAFVVTPGINEQLLQAAGDSQLPLLPGVMTPSDITTAVAAGYDRLKFFPARVAGGCAALKAFAGPFPEVKFCPTGGVTADTMGDYLSLENVLCVGGSWLAPMTIVTEKRWSEITELARHAVAAGRSIVDR